MKGGSIASDAVTKLVTQTSYDMLSKNFSNSVGESKCGGGKKSSKVIKKASKAVPARKVVASRKTVVRKSRKGGNIFSDVSKAVTNALMNKTNLEGYSNVFRSQPAPAGAEYANLRSISKGLNSKTSSNANSKASALVSDIKANVKANANANTKVTGSNASVNAKAFTGSNASVNTNTMKPNANVLSYGGSFQAKNLSEYMNANAYSIKNRKGGTVSAPVTGTVAPPKMELDYSIIPTTGKMEGEILPRATPDAVNRLMASESVATLPALNKISMYGAVNDTQHNFGYDSPSKLSTVGGRKKGKKSKKINT